MSDELSMFDPTLDECDRECVLRLNELAAEGVFVNEEKYRAAWRDEWEAAKGNNNE